jgi:hypothetical protein
MVTFVICARLKHESDVAQNSMECPMSDRHPTDKNSCSENALSIRHSRKLLSYLRKLLICTLIFLATAPALAAELIVEAESFQQLGGWTIDPQFMDAMGSPFLLAHGLGKSVAAASTNVKLPQPGKYTVWVRTRDWLVPHHPGTFRVSVNGQALDAVFGQDGSDWHWQYGGTVDIARREATLTLKDLTGFDARCDAIFFSTDQNPPPAADNTPAGIEWRRRQLHIPAAPPTAGDFDVIVVGGGIAGCAAAWTAATLGCHVALIQNRNVLGGNASSEIGITPRGKRSSVLEPLIQRTDSGDLRAQAVLQATDHVELFLGWHAVRVTMQFNRIQSVVARQITTARELSFMAPVVIDCTGIAAVGSLANADVRSGRESRDEFNESLAPIQADAMHHGNTVVFRTRLADQPVDFPDVPWARDVAGNYSDLGGQVLSPGVDNQDGPRAGPPSAGANLTHFWEYGQWVDTYEHGELVRDHLFCAIYGTFSNLKRLAPRALAHLELDYVGHVPASGEYRRLMGDYILTENDIRQRTRFPDSVAVNSGHFCLHYPGNRYDFRLGDWKWIPVEPFEIPFRCLRSRNVANLLMAGKHISVTHVAGSCTKTMLNGGQHGVAVGAAAALCIEHSTTPDGVAIQHLEKLRATIHNLGSPTQIAAE